MDAPVLRARREGGTMDVVLRLRELRRMRGLSQRDAAAKAGIGEKSISSFETGERISSMKLSQLEQILRAYGVTIKEFFSDQIDRRIAPWDVPREEEEMHAILEDLQGLPRKRRAALIQKFRLMVESATEAPRAAQQPVPGHPDLHRDWSLLNSRN